MTLSLVISNLTCGGAQRVLVLLADEWARRGHSVEILTLADRPVFFQPSPAVPVVCLGVERPSRGPFDAAGQLKRTVTALRAHWKFRRPDAVVAFTTRVNIKALLAARPMKIPVVVSERTDPRAAGESRAWKLLRRWTFPRSGAVVVQSPEAAAYFRSYGLGDRLRIVPNPVPRHPDGPEIRDPALVVSVGRLDRKKGHDLLLRAFAQVRHPGARLRIVGNGPQRPELEALAQTLGLGGRCDFIGESGEPRTHLGEAGLFVLPSRVEGFPNALAEAMAAGLACASFDCPSGPRQLLRSGENGLLVPPEDTGALAEAIDLLLSDPSLRRRFGEAARRSLEPLEVGAVVDLWDGILSRTVAR